MVTMQRGGGSKDTWVMSPGQVDTSFSLLRTTVSPADLVRTPAGLPSRLAENLFWLGRYLERALASLRLLRIVLEPAEDRYAPADWSADSQHALMQALAQLTGRPLQTVHPVRGATAGDWSALLADAGRPGSVAFDLQALERAALALRERLSSEHWRLLVETSNGFRDDCARARAGGEYSADEVLSVLARLAVQLAAVTGAQMDRMTRDDGWRLRLWAKNLTDRKYYTVVNASALGDSAAPAAPRTYGAALDFRLGS
jgi:hypothetical protein